MITTTAMRRVIVGRMGNNINHHHAITHKRLYTTSSSSSIIIAGRSLSSSSSSHRPSLGNLFLSSSPSSTSLRASFSSSSSISSPSPHPVRTRPRYYPRAPSYGRFTVGCVERGGAFPYWSRSRWTDEVALAADLAMEVYPDPTLCDGNYRTKEDLKRKAKWAESMEKSRLIQAIPIPRLPSLPHPPPPPTHPRCDVVVSRVMPIVGSSDCVYSIHPSYTDYAFGSDGIIHRLSTGAIVPMVVGTHYDNRIEVVLDRDNKLMSDESIDQQIVVVGSASNDCTTSKAIRILADELILIAHGYARPDHNAIVVTRDGNARNLSLDNLCWQTTDDVLHQSVCDAADAGYHLEYRICVRYSHMHIGNDGSMWNLSQHYWSLLHSPSHFDYFGPGMIAAVRPYDDPWRGTQLHASWQDERRDKLIASVFVPGEPNRAGAMIHINKDCNDDRASNLKWRKLPDVPYKRVPPSRPASTPPQRPLESRGRVCDVRPPDAIDGVTYCRYPIAPYQHYIVGTDGSVYDSNARKWDAFNGYWDDDYVSHVKFVSVYKCDTRINDDAPAGTRPIGLMWYTFIPLAEMMLTAHGYEKPKGEARARYSNNDNKNVKLDNLYWQTSDDVIKHAISSAATSGDVITYRPHHIYDRYMIGTDGRVFDPEHHEWLIANAKTGYVAVGRSRHDTKLMVHISHLIWSTHRPLSPLGVTHQLSPIDGDARNVSLSNLSMMPISTTTIDGQRSWRSTPILDHDVTAENIDTISNDDVDGSDTKLRVAPKASINRGVGLSMTGRAIRQRKSYAKRKLLEREQEKGKPTESEEGEE